MVIPKIVHLIWLGDAPLPRPIFEQIKRVYSEWRVCLWRDTDRFIMAPAKQLSFLKGKKLYSCLSDFGRFQVLYRFGGIYMDMDFWAINPFDVLETDKIMMPHEPGNYLAPFFTVAPAKHPTIVKLISLLTPEYIQSYSSNNDYGYIAGPRFLTQNLSSSEYTLIPYDKCGILTMGEAKKVESLTGLSAKYPSAYGVHLWNHYSAKL